MINPKQYHRILATFPHLERATPQVVYEFQQAAYFASLPAGKTGFAGGESASALALALSGTVRVYLSGNNGREITLYRFGRGESCILTANAILNNQPFPANAMVEQPVEAVLIPDNVFRDWVDRYALWREFTFSLLSLRLTSVLTLVEDIVFRRMEARVASFLRQRCQIENPISVTHQEIATELGSSREVISRILECFTAAGLIRSARGIVEILDFDSLNARSSV